MAGKYDHILPSLPRLEAQSDDPIHQGRINATKDIITAPRTDDEPPALPDFERGRYLARVAADLKTLHRDLARSLAGQPLTAASLVRGWRDARDLKDRLAELVSNTSLLVSAFEQLMIAAMDVEDTKSIKLLDGRGVNIHYEPGIKVLDLEAARQWADADSDLRLKLRLWPSTLESLIKKMLVAGEEVPEWVEVTSVPVAKKSG